MKKQIIKNIGPAGHRRRLKERFCNADRKTLADYEFLELLLTYAIPRVDTKPAAKALLKQYKTIFNVLQQSPERLMEIKGIGPEAATYLRTIGRFEIKKPLSVVSFRNYQLPESPFNEENLEWKIQLAALFERLAEEISRPALREVNESVYLSTQYLCDWVKHSNHDGIEYPSAMGKGFNVVLLDPANAVPSDIRYLRIREINRKCETIDPDEQLYDEGPFDYLVKTTSQKADP